MFFRIWQYFPNTQYIVWTLLIEEPRLINPRQGLSAIKSGSAKSDHNTRYKNNNFSKNLFSSSLRMVNIVILISFEQIRDNLWRQLHSFLNPSQWPTLTNISLIRLWSGSFFGIETLCRGVNLRNYTLKKTIFNQLSNTQRNLRLMLPLL